MKQRLALLSLLALWMYLCRPHLEEQFSTTGQALAALAGLTWDDRTAAFDQPGYRVAQEIARAVPPEGCMLVLSRTGPEHIRYYQSRFAYYLYPRYVRVSDRTDAAAGDCAHLAVFRDTPANLAQEPFHGHWDDRQLAEHTAVMTKLLSGERVEVFR